MIAGKDATRQRYATTLTQLAHPVCARVARAQIYAGLGSLTVTLESNANVIYVPRLYTI